MLFITIITIIINVIYNYLLLQDKSFDKYCIYESSAELRERIVDLTELPSKRIQELTEVIIIIIIIITLIISYRDH